MTATAAGTAGESLGAALRAGRDALTAASASSARDAELLLLAASGVSRTALHAWPERVLDATARARYEAWIARRAAGWPVAYLIGRRGFWELELAVTPDVLIPRPETELLLERALAAPAAQALDLGTGSGALALALARAWPGARVDAVERSPAALAVARDNGLRLGLGNIRWLEGCWYGPVAGGRYDVIVANPPYIAADEPEPGEGDARFEPRAALIAGPTGLEALSEVIAGAPGHLAPGGRLLVEHGHRQGAPVRDLFRAAGLGAITTHPDLAGDDRVTEGRLGDPCGSDTDRP